MFFPKLFTDGLQYHTPESFAGGQQVFVWPQIHRPLLHQLGESGFI
jgi:hypothetical protein